MKREGSLPSRVLPKERGARRGIREPRGAVGVVTEPDSRFLTSAAGGWKDFSRTLVPQKAAFTETPCFLNGLFKPRGLDATKNKAEPSSQPARRLLGGGEDRGRSQPSLASAPGRSALP